VYGADPAATTEGEPELGGEATEEADDASIFVGGVPGASCRSAKAATAAAAAAAAAAVTARTATAPRSPV